MTEAICRAMGTEEGRGSGVCVCVCVCGGGGGGSWVCRLRLKTEEARHQPPPEQINVKEARGTPPVTP